jgi:hypothetical protein
MTERNSTNGGYEWRNEKGRSGCLDMPTRDIRHSRRSAALLDFPPVIRKK